MISEREAVILDRIHNLAGQHFKDFVIFVRPSNGGGVSWRSSDVNWAESVARNYCAAVQLNVSLDTINDYNRRGGT